VGDDFCFHEWVGVPGFIRDPQDLTNWTAGWTATEAVDSMPVAVDAISDVVPAAAEPGTWMRWRANAAALWADFRYIAPELVRFAWAWLCMLWTVLWQVAHFTHDVQQGEEAQDALDRELELAADAVVAEALRLARVAEVFRPVTQQEIAHVFIRGLNEVPIDEGIQRLSDIVEQERQTFLAAENDAAARRFAVPALQLERSDSIDDAGDQLDAAGMLDWDDDHAEANMGWAVHRMDADDNIVRREALCSQIHGRAAKKAGGWLFKAIECRRDRQRKAASAAASPYDAAYFAAILAATPEQG